MMTTHKCIRYVIFNSIVFLSTTALVDYSCLHKNNWQVSDNDYINYIFGSFTDILSSEYIKTNSSYQWQIVAAGIPNYNRNFTNTDINNLNNRPLAATDFVNGQTKAVAGNTYIFGSDLGYVKTATRGTCKGYWPPIARNNISKPDSCPWYYNDEDDATEEYNLLPSEEIGNFSYDWSWQNVIGRAVNGILLYNGLENKHFSNWSALSPFFDKYNMDICSGHANAGEDIYHHHSYSQCLATVVNDDGLAHSPIYGFAKDGYPIYGPYQESNQLAISCWQLRDYKSNITGCGSNSNNNNNNNGDGNRTCQLIDEYDYRKGIISMVSNYGPSFSQILSTSNGNTIIAKNGVYYEDYFYNTTCASLSLLHLNQFNGHSHDDLGFHYHMTIDSSGSPTFPYITGPKLFGCFPSNSLSSCGTTTAKKLTDSACIPQTSSSNSSSLATTVIGVIIISLFLFIALLVAGFCCVVCIRRSRKLLPTFDENGLNDAEMIERLPHAEVVMRGKPSSGVVVGANLITAIPIDDQEATRGRNNMSMVPITATAIPLSPSNLV